MASREENKAAAEKFLEALRPTIEKLCRDVESQGKAIFSGFIFCQQPPCIVHLGTVDNKGDDLIRLHVVLSSLIAEGLAGRYPNVLFKEYGPGVAPVTSSQSPELIADELARLLLVTGADVKYLDQIFSLAQNYMALRRQDSSQDESTK